MSEYILEAGNLVIETKKTGISLVKELSFAVPSGSVFGIAGESGSGKSLTALSMMRLLHPALELSSGAITFRSREGIIKIESIPEKQLKNIRGKNISMIFQEPMTSLNPAMTCGKQIEEVLSAHTFLNKNERKDKLLTLMEEVRLPEPHRILASYPHQLSGGQRQRIMIAMAVAAGPELLIADEPTTALDVRVQKAIISLLMDLRQKMGLSMIFISHDLRLLGDIADEIMVMQHGQKAESGPATDILSRPVHPYTRGLISCLPPLNTKPFRLPTLHKSEVKPGTGKTSAKPSGEIILSVRNIHITYPSRKKDMKYFLAVDNLSFDIYKGETFGLVGESGCGKTTLGRAILKLMDTRDGQIFFKGESIRDMKKNALKTFRQKVQVVFQDPYSSLNPRMTAGQMLCETIGFHFPSLSSGQRRKRAAYLLEMTGLHQTDLNKYPHEFSGGQRQRLSIARALATEPEFLVLDESVSALDVSVQAQVLNLLNDLKEEFSLSFLFISHDLAVVKYMSDRMMVMRDGRKEEEGDPEQLFRNPLSEYTAALIDAIPGRN